MMKKVAVVFGTRPEAIKLAPIVMALRKDPCFDCRVCVTAQHRQMLDQVLDIFEIVPDKDLDLMKANQTLGELTSKAVGALDRYFASEKPDVVLVQGDTTTVLSGALSAFYNRIPIGHVEAGLRTGNMFSPWPEEMNRVLTTRLAKWHFAPTESNRKNLLNEGVPESRIHVVGNTVIDALFLALAKIRRDNPKVTGFPEGGGDPLDGRRMVLITGHRRENFGNGFENICRAIADLAIRFQEVVFVYPVHLNPNVREPVERILRRPYIRNVYLIEPLDYLPFVALMNKAHLILTDSGGVQEEAPSLGKPVLVMRDTTERPEAVVAGTVRLIGSSYESIVANTSELLTNQELWEHMSRIDNPYGDGASSERILEILKTVVS